MRSSIVLVLYLASVLSAEPLSPRLANIIPSDARSVIGLDFTRYQHSTLRMLYPALLEGGLAEALGSEGVQQVRQVVVVERSADSGRGSLTILRVSGPLAIASDSALADSGPNGVVALLDASTAVVGDPGSVQDAVERWNHPSDESEVAAMSRRMSESYDNWFVAIRPMEGAALTPAGAGNLKYRAAFAGLVEDVSGGIRIGGVDELRADVTLKSADDALAAAALARWLPGLIQMKSPGSLESDLADLAENVKVVTAGQTVSVSFVLDEAKLEILAKSRARANNPEW